MKSTAVVAILLAVCLELFAERRPTVVVLSTGGTIARHDAAKGGYEPVLTGENLVEAIPAIRQLAQVHVEQISNISSSDMNPAIWLQLARRANDLLAGPDITGIVVTHGTNTLEETAYFLDLVTSSTKLVIGRQRSTPGFRPGL
ncbi:MAG: asparaginase domain-containing protein [Bryobacteraceae bacterium]